MFAELFIKKIIKQQGSHVNERNFYLKGNF